MTNLRCRDCHTFASKTWRAILPGIVTAAIFLVAAIMVAPAQATILHYYETFNTQSHQVLSAFDWSAHYGTNATAYPLDSTESDENPFVAGVASGGGDDSGTGSANGYLFHAAGLNANGEHMWWTDELTPFDVADLHSLQVDARTTNPGENGQFAIQVGTQWYLMADTLLTSSGSSSWAEDITSEADTERWVLWDFEPGVNLGTGSHPDVDRPTTGTVNAVGIRNHDIDNNTRFDNFEVYTVPEPTTLALLAMILAATGVRTRRRTL